MLKDINIDGALGVFDLTKFEYVDTVDGISYLNRGRKSLYVFAYRENKEL